MTRTTFHTWFRPRTLAATALGLVGACGVAQAAVDFNPRVHTPLGGPALALAAADMTSDGVLDLVAAGAAGVSVVRGTGGGAFAPGAVATVGAETFAVAVGDFNADMKMDAVTASSKAGTVSVVLGDGNGGFGAPSTITVGQEPYALAIGDLSGDGKPDIAVANSKSQNVSLLVGNGDGTFSSNLIAIGATTPFAIAVGDVTGDGVADLVVPSAGIRVLPGPWNGSSFGAPLQISSKLVPQALALADLNRDGRLDIVAGNAANNVSVVISLGGVGFQVLPPQPASNTPAGVAVGDVSGDSVPDIVVANVNSKDISVLEGVGDGSVRPGVQFAVGREPLAVVASDMTGDGRSDVIVGSYEGLATFVARPLTPGVATTARRRVPCRTPRTVVLGQELGCIALLMSPAQVKELLGAPRAIVQRPRDRETWFDYGRTVVVFDSVFNYVTVVGSTKPGVGLSNGVRIGAAAALVKRRYARAACRAVGTSKVTLCRVKTGTTSETYFRLSGGKIVEIDVAVQF